MNTQGTRFEQMLKIRRTTLGFGVVQIILGVALIALSFAAFAFTSSDRIRNACPYWAGFAVFCSGGVGVITWRLHSSVLSMGLFTFLSAACVVLQMIGTILTGDAGGLLKSLATCERDISGKMCLCCNSVLVCKQGFSVIEFEGVNDCNIITGLLKELIYGLCVVNICGCLVCFIATILGCTAVAREMGRHQGLCNPRHTRRPHNHNHECYNWTQYPTGLTILPSYAPPVYHSVENFQEFAVTSCIVPPPVFDPTDLPPPYSSQNPSLAESQCSLSCLDSCDSQQQFPVSQEMEGHFWPALADDHQAVNSSSSNRPQRAPGSQPSLCSSPSEVIELEGCDLNWEEPMDPTSQITEPASHTNFNLSPNAQSYYFCHRREMISNNIYLNSCKAENGNVNASSIQCPQTSSSMTRMQHQDIAGSVSNDLNSGERVVDRAADVLPAVEEAEVNVPPFCSPVRGTTIVSLRSRSRSLGEHSIYVNSFEVMSSPPPNVQVPDDDEQVLYSLRDADDFNDDRNILKCVSKGASRHVISVTQRHFRRRSGERESNKRLKKPLNTSKQDRERSLHMVKNCTISRCAMLKTQLNPGRTTSITHGKETSL